MKIQITPSRMLNPGTVERLLSEMNVGPILSKADMIRCEMNEQQIALFRLRGGAHRIEILPDAPPVPQVVVPTVEEVLKAGYSPAAAERIVARETQRAILLAALQPDLSKFEPDTKILEHEREPDPSDAEPEPPAA